MAIVNYIKTEFDSLSTINIINGQIIFSQDTQELYIDYDNKRTAINDIIYVDTYTSLPIAGLENKLYFLKDTNKLYRFLNTGSWNCINDTSSIESSITNINTQIESIQTNITNLQEKKYYKSVYELPTVGEVDIIYFCNKIAYLWDDTELKYVPITDSIEEISIINGGSAS